MTIKQETTLYWIALKKRNNYDQYAFFFNKEKSNPSERNFAIVNNERASLGYY